MQLKVVKSDSSVEEYLHTKVIGTFNNALEMVDQANVFVAEQLAEAVTYHLYHEKAAHMVTCDEIHTLIESVLNATGYPEAADMLNDYRLARKLRRRRLEVIDFVTPDSRLAQYQPQQWNKSYIIDDLVNKNGLDRQIARVIASSVEQKILNLEIMRVPRQLIHQLVITEMDSMLEAHRQLQCAVG